MVVSEEEIATAILLLLEREKTVAEGAGAVSDGRLVHLTVRMPDRPGSLALITQSSAPTCSR